MPSWMSVAEAAEVLGVNGRQVRNLAAHSQLDARRLGRSWLVSADSVDIYRRERREAGRPLSAEFAWWLLAGVDAALSREPALDVAPSDRRERHRLRKLQLSMPAPERWSSWMRRRAVRRHVWFHPGAKVRIESDKRVVRPDLSAELGLAAFDLAHPYVDASDFEAFVADHRGQVVEGSEAGDAAEVMVVPELPEELDWRSHVGASALVDLSVHADARVRHAACGRLHIAADRISVALNVRQTA